MLVVVGWRYGDFGGTLGMVGSFEAMALGT
jgi:hypothetical protein